jgi:pseudolysin
MKFRLTTLMAGLAMTNIAFAATQIDLHRQPAAYLQNKINTQMGKMKIEIVRIDVDFNGTTHTRIQETYDGIPVWDATGVIHTPKNASRKLTLDANTTMNGIIYENLEKDLATTSALKAESAASALQAAKSLFIKKSRLSAAASFGEEKSSPIIFIDENKKAHRAYLTSFLYTTSSAVHRPTSIVDAVTRQVYKTWEGIFTENIQEKEAIALAKAKVQKMLNDGNPSSEIYDIKAGGIGGNVKKEMVYDGAEGNRAALNMQAIDTAIELIPGRPYTITLCILRNDDIDVVDVSTGSEVVASVCIPDYQAHNGVAWLSMEKGATRWNDDEMNEGYSPSLDSFYAAMMIKNLYHDWLNEPALIDGNKKPLKFIMRTHFGRQFDNAFWDGKQMTFGDGGRMFYPLTSVGVAAHEISHGFTETHSNIDGSQPQMAALHESFSDMAAVAIENYMTGENKWEIGREIMKNEGALRYLNEPTKDGVSIDHLRDFDNTEPHRGAGITNKAFYLLATTKGWNVRKAFEVMAKANMHYWTSSMTTFGEAACGVVAETQESGYNVADVRIAFAKVGIDTDQCESTPRF